MSVFMLIQYMDSCFSSPVLWIPMWLMCSCFLVACHVVLQILLFFCLSLQGCQWLHSHLWKTNLAAGLFVPQFWFMAIHEVQFLTACLCAHHLALLFLFCHIQSWYGHAWLFWIDGNVHSLALFVLWLDLDSQFVMNSAASGLYSILMLYWFIVNTILWSICDKLATSFLNITTNS